MRFTKLSPVYISYRKKVVDTLSKKALSGLHALDAEKADMRNSRAELNGTQSGALVFHTELMKENVTTILKSAKNEVMVMNDLAEALNVNVKSNRQQRRWFTRMIDNLVKTNHVERVNVSVAEYRANGEEYVHTERCLRLVRTYMPRVARNMGLAVPAARKQHGADPESAVIVGEGGMLADLPFEWQVYRLIALAGDRGLTAGDIRRSLNYIGSKIIEKVLKKITKPSDAPHHAIGASQVAEFVGRERRYRYYSAEAFNRLMGHSENAAELGLLKQLKAAKAEQEQEKQAEDEPEDGPRKRRRTAQGQARKTAENAAPEEDDEQRTPYGSPHRSRSYEGCPNREIPQTPVPMDLDEPASFEREGNTVCNVCKIVKDDAALLVCGSCDIAVHTCCIDPSLTTPLDGNYFCGETCRVERKLVHASGKSTTESVEGSATPSQAHIQRPMTPSRRSATTTPSRSAPASGKAYDRTTITAVRRRKHLLALLDHNKILEVNQDMIRNYQLQEAQDGTMGPHTVDKKTIMRTALSMEVDGLLKIQTVSLMQMNGSYQTRTLLVDPSIDLDGRFLKDYIEMMQDRQVIYRGSTVSGPAPKIEVHDIEIERLTDIQRRLNLELTDLSTPPPPILSFEPETQQSIPNVDPLPAMKGLSNPSSAVELSHSPGDPPRFGGRRAERLRKAGMAVMDSAGEKEDAQIDDGDETENWTTVARQYGYISPKMLRAHTLHNWLFKLMAVRDSSTPTSNEPFRDRGVFSSSVLLRELTFDMYLKIVGQRTQVECIDEFLEREGSREAAISQWPEIVRHEVFSSSSKTRYRRLIKLAIDILVGLRVLRPVTSTGEENPPAPAGKAEHQLLYPAYRMEPVVPIYDYVVNPEIKLGDYEVTTLDGVEHFWGRLELVCRRHTRKRRLRPEGAGLPEHDGSEWDPSMSRESTIEVADDADVYLAGPSVQGGVLHSFSSNHVLAQLDHTRNWVEPYVYTAAQRKILDQHMDSKAGITPVRNDAVCERLAHESGLTVTRVKAYYSKTEEQYLRKAESKQRMLATRKHNREKRRRETEEKNNFLAQQYQDERAAKRLDQRQERWNSDLQATTKRKSGPVGLEREARLKGRRSYRTGAGNGPASGKGPVIAAASGIEEMDGETVPVIEDEDRFQTQYNQAAKRRKANFTKQDDEILLHGYAILNCYRTQRFSWQPLADVFSLRRVISENRNQMRDICRRRVLLLTKTTTQLDYVNNLSALWPAISSNAVAQGKFTQSEIDDRTPERLAHLISYFIIEATTKPGAKNPLNRHPVHELPKTVAELHKIFRIAEKVTSGIPYKAPVPIEEELAERHSMRTRMSVLYSRSLTMLLHEQHVVDAGAVGIPPPSVESIQERVVVALVKMMLMTPEDRYDSARAFMMLQSFPQVAVAAALTLLCDEQQAIVKVKGSQDRRVPGRGFVLSDKFLHAITGSLPDRLMPQAISFADQLDRRLKEEGEVEFSPFVNGGSMTVLLDALAYRRAKAVTRWPTLVIPIAKMKPFDIYDDPSKGHFDVVVTSHECNEKDRRLQMDEQVPAPMHLEQSAEGPINEELAEVDVAPPSMSNERQTVVAEDPPRELRTPQTPTDIRSPDSETHTAMVTGPLKHIAACADSLYQSLREAGPVGLSASELQRVATGLGYSVGDVVESLRASSLIVAVGFDQLRYIARDHINTWTIPAFVKPLANAVPSSRVVEMSLMTDENGNPTPARMWYDINGDQVETTKRACMEATLGHIVQMPGIYESKLYSKLANVMSRVELSEILQFLVDRRACRRRVFIKPKPVRSILHGLFEDSDEEGFLQEDPESMSEMKISCYWPESEWFRKTS
ncbi:hypothetical protein HDU86_006357 [Geranomyces michiganensis]|nr:hypothetical protein HDU86_006357 [Geranomyces michiganensis]